MPLNQPLGDFLRAQRARLQPSDSESRESPRRRTPGLKREEVAQRAGISTEWYVKLEQGRARGPSPATLDALARALELDDPKTAQLTILASAGGKAPFQRETVPAVMRRIVNRLPEPAYITGQRMDVLAWNPAAAALFPDLVSMAEADRNLLLWMFTQAGARDVFGDAWEAEARRMVSLFRTSSDLWPGDPAFTDLVERLRTMPETPFETWWAEHGAAAPSSGLQSLHHPTLGLVRYAASSFQATDDPALRLTLYART